ncbi:unnamed protein product [Trypanosoma congolense IL3000]|uniref:WGS project CAEQ00000000 data, annotated contig 962 n=1 Tax=Trypanosoma congolense (strain IL3000) TaxID=1068625 RepID=F9WJX4_TRYCI|nr:unnamed protein product [Trypanosoma congolense IL3000]
MYLLVDDLTEEYGVNRNSVRERRFLKSAVPPWSVSQASKVTFGLTLEYDTSLTHKDAIRSAKKWASLHEIDKHNHFQWLIATDGGVQSPMSAGVGLLFKSVTHPVLAKQVSVNCGSVSSSYRAESVAMLLALDKLVIPMANVEHRTLLIVTDSQSLLNALSKGPLSQCGHTEENMKWARLIELTLQGWLIHFQFCHRDCGTVVNEMADEYATQCMKDGHFKWPSIKPLWYTNLVALITRQLKKRWLASLRTDTHRYKLCGAKPSDLSGLDLIDGTKLTRSEMVQLARARCGESEYFGRLFWSLRDCLPTCRFCNCTPEQAAVLSHSSLPKEGLDASTNTAQETAERPRANKNRRREPCPYCDADFVEFTKVKQHCKTQHSDQPKPAEQLQCDFRGEEYSNRRSTAQHRMRCKQNPNHIRLNNSGTRRKSHMPDVQPPTTLVDVGNMETLHHILHECNEARRILQEMGILDELEGKYTSWVPLQAKNY